MPKFFISILILLFSIHSFGQSTKLIKGRLVDEKTENPVEKVGLTLKNKATKVLYKTETLDNGEFLFKNIPFGVGRVDRGILVLPALLIGATMCLKPNKVLSKDIPPMCSFNRCNH